MKFVWETDDCWSGRKIRFTPRRSGQRFDAMIFADNSIGGASRFGIVDLDNGLVTIRGKTQSELADWMTDSYAPVALTKEEEED